MAPGTSCCPERGGPRKAPHGPPADVSARRAGAAKPRLPLLELCCLGAMILFSPEASARGQLRHALPLAGDWRFLRADAPGAEAPAFDDRAWARVSVPHTWNAKDGQDGGGDYYRGVGWYRRRVTLPKDETGRQLYVECDGANLETTLFVNGHEVGHHAGGFARFRFDVTSVAKPGAVNLLAFKVTNAPNPNVP